MREIKFRAYRNTRHGKRYVYSHTDKGKSRLGWFFSNYRSDRGYVIEQYTGLKDKNGKSIYEGDVIATPHFQDAAGRSHILKHIVQWSSKYHSYFLLNCASMSETDGSIQLFVAKAELLEIVGNIYENPELLE